MNGLSPHSPTLAAFAAARISAEKLLVPFARAAKAIRRCCPATPDLRTSTKNSFRLPNPTPEGKKTCVAESLLTPPLHVLSQRRRQSPCYFPCPLNIVRIKRNGRDSLVSATTKLFRKRRQVLVRSGLIPRIRT